MRVGAAIQELLGLKTDIVAIGMRRKKRDFELPVTRPRVVAYNHNIPVDHRQYIHTSNQALVQLYIDAFDDLKLSDYAASLRMLPYSRLRNDILNALRLFPGRTPDADILARAFSLLESFLLESNIVLAKAIAARPDLKPYLEQASKLSRANAGADALDGKSSHTDLLLDDALIQQALQLRNQAQIKEADLFFDSADCIQGVSPNATPEHVEQLARGRLMFPNLDSLLRFGPVGIVYYQRRFYEYYNPETRIREPQSWVEAKAIFPRLIRALAYEENPNTPRVWRVEIITGPNGYEGLQHPLTPYPVDVSPEAREHNAVRAERLIKQARLRMGWSF